MKEIICDLPVDLFDHSQLSEILRFLRIKNIGVNCKLSKLNEIKIENIKLFSRLTLKEKNGINAKTLKNELRKNRQKYQFISVEPLTASMASIAVRDGRVDAIRIGPKSSLRIFNNRFGRRIEENSKIIEVDITCLFSKTIAKNLRPLLRVIKSFERCSIPYILTTELSSIFQIRSYRGLQAIGKVIGISNYKTKSDVLLDRIELNDKKLSGKIPFPGVELI